MNDRFQRESIGDGVWFSSVTDPKFKHNRISANLLVGLESETASVNAALPFILRRGCRSCPDFTMLNQKLCELYGASLSCDVSKFGGYQVLELSIYGIDDRFTLDNAPLARECAALLCDVLLDPKLSDGAFDEQDTALERQQLVDTIEGQINDKRLYALTRCKSLMCAGEPIAVDKYGSIPDAKAITARSAAEAYRRVVETAQVELFFVGSGDPAEAKETFRTAFSGIRRSPAALEKVQTALRADRVREQTDEMDVAQSKLVMGFRTGEIKDRRAFGGMRMMVALFGGTPTSRLFTYVREKLSLCYYCAARFDRLTGLMFVDSGVEKQNGRKAYDEILRQLDCVRRGEFTDEELTATRLLMQTSLEAVGDSLSATEEWYLTQIVGGAQYSAKDESALLDEVTREDVIAAAGQVTLDTVYFLTGKEAE